MKCQYPFLIFLLLLLGSLQVAFSQTSWLEGQITTGDGEPLAYATVQVSPANLATTSDQEGQYQIRDLPQGHQIVTVSYLGFQSGTDTIEIKSDATLTLDFVLAAESELLDEIVVTGTMRAVSRQESPVPVEVFRPVFFRKNPTPNIYEALQNINGVRPQLNCQVCNTGDIHINGLEGPYTMVLIDGMPIVSSLATVYGLSGIPNSMIERVEIVRGPASSLYGSEAIGGLINIITKSPQRAPSLSVELMGTSWSEWNADLGFRMSLCEDINVFTGINYYHYDRPFDHNLDHFTDVALQERISLFQKWNLRRSGNRIFNIAARYYQEDRWGGELDWTPAYRGGDEIYGEAIRTKRWELLGQYQLPVSEKLVFSLSLNGHEQNSVYGNIPYIADQKIGFAQLVWEKQKGTHSLLGGTTLRYTWYDDNTPATQSSSNPVDNMPDKIWLPGLFVQDEVSLHNDHKVLLGMRYDYNDAHGSIFTPRLAYKWSISDNDLIRVNAGTGFRVVNLFTEDHAALTGAREVVIAEALKPERSYNVNLNYVRKKYFENGASVTLDLSAWYTYFTNVILPDYETNSNQIIYDNLNGAAVTKGISFNADLTMPAGLTMVLGATVLDVSSREDGPWTRQILTERFTGTWSISYPVIREALQLDYTGNIYGPMRLPLLGPLDPRPAESPWWSIQNIQATYTGWQKVEVFAGIKNLLDWTPWKNLDHPIIARAFDPFDRQVQFNDNGQVSPTVENPFALSFDPTYVYAPNQGLRIFAGIRYTLH